MWTESGEKEENRWRKVEEHLLYTNKKSQGILHILACCLSPKNLILEKKKNIKM